MTLKASESGVISRSVTGTQSHLGEERIVHPREPDHQRQNPSRPDGGQHPQDIQDDADDAPDKRRSTHGGGEEHRRNRHADRADQQRDVEVTMAPAGIRLAGGGNTGDPGQSEKSRTRQDRGHLGGLSKVPLRYIDAVGGIRGKQVSLNLIG